jgi:flagellar assembly protein FliH
MATDRNILKMSRSADQMIFDYHPKEFTMAVTGAAVDYVHDEIARKSDFQISDLAAQQSGVSKLENERSQILIDEQVLQRLKDVQEKAYKEAYALGHSDGAAAAFEESKAELIARLKSLDAMLTSIEVLKNNFLKDNEAQFVELALEIGKHIALRDLSSNREAIVTLMQRVVGELHGEQQLTAHVAPADLAVLEALQASTETKIESLSRMKLISDAKVESGGCLLETAFGEIDLQLQDRVERLWQSLQTQIIVNQKT